MTKKIPFWLSFQLLLCGPSPGRADDNEQRSLGGGERPKDVPVRIGGDTCKIEFQSNKGRTKRWRSLVYAVFDDEKQGDSLTCVGNLDWGHYGNHRDIPPANLEQGPATVLEVMKVSQPCVVVTLVTVTWDYLEAYLREFFEASQSQPPTIEGKKSLKYRVMNLPDCPHKTLLLKSPHHPSRHFFTDIHCRQIKDTVKWFRETYL